MSNHNGGNCVWVYESGSLFIESGADLNTTGDTTWAIGNRGTVYMRGGTVKGSSAYYQQYGAMLNMSGGTMSGSKSDWPTVALQGSGSAYISGGTITNSSGYYGLYVWPGVSCSITGGSISSRYGV